MRDVYLAVVRLRLSQNEQFADGLSELLAKAEFEPYRVDIVLGLLREFPNASPFRLNELLAATAKLPAAHKSSWISLVRFFPARFRSSSASMISGSQRHTSWHLIRLSRTCGSAPWRIRILFSIRAGLARIVSLPRR